MRSSVCETRKESTRRKVFQFSHLSIMRATTGLRVKTIRLVVNIFAPPYPPKPLVNPGLTARIQHFSDPQKCHLTSGFVVWVRVLGS